MLMMSMTVTAFAAESSVTFESGKVIAFEPGSVYTETDLFDNFKGVMPGDTLSEEVTIQNKSNDCCLLYTSGWYKCLPEAHR